MDSCTPSKMTTTRHNVPWINRTLIRLTRKKQRLFNKAKKKKGNEAWSRYKFCKKQVTQQIRKARSEYLFGNSSAPSEEKTLELHRWSPRGNCLLMADLKQKSWTTNSNPSLLRRSPLTYLRTSTASRSSLVTSKRTKPPDLTTSPAVSWKKLPLNWPRFWPTSSNTHYEMASSLTTRRKHKCPLSSKKERPTMLRTITPFRSPVSAANSWSTSSVTISMNIWTSIAYYRPYNRALNPAIPVSPNSLSRRMTWASPTMRRNKWISQSLISPRPLIKSRTNDSWGNWGTTGSPDKPVDGFKPSSAIVHNV